MLPSLGKCRTFCCRSNQGTLSDYGNILGNSSLRAQVASAGGTARGKPHQLLHPELEHNLQRAQCGPFCFPGREFHWHRDRDGLRIPTWPRLNRYFLHRNAGMTESAKVWFGTGNVAELKTPDGSRVIKHDWRYSSRTFFKVSGENVNNKHTVFSWLLFLQNFQCITDTFSLKYKNQHPQDVGVTPKCAKPKFSVMNPSRRDSLISIFFLVSVKLWRMCH